MLSKYNKKYLWYIIKNLPSHMIFYSGGKYKNQHLPASKAKLRRLMDDIFAYARPSFSDEARISEFLNSIYVPRIDLTDKAKRLNPKIIVDIGANIGLSSLSLSKAFPSAQIIVGIEAEYENYSVLEKNYDLWNRIMNDRLMDANNKIYVSDYSVASNISKQIDDQLRISSLSGGISASGTFRFIWDNETNSTELSEQNPFISKYKFSNKSLCVNDIYGEHLANDEFGVVKIDIEGGEEQLFTGNCEWLKKTIFLTVEVHDRMGIPRSSSNLIKNLAKYDFAVVPEKDILHCYNRNLLGLF